MKKIFKHHQLIYIFAMFACILVSVIMSSNSYALNFTPGNIISNYTMGNSNSMTEAEIQSFLDSMSRCNTANLPSDAYRDGDYYIRVVNGTTYRWHLDNNGNFICLNQERFSNDGAIGYGDTAAHIIYTLAQQYRVNPQVILVILQKEQGLLTDPYPNDYDFNWGLGFGVPDHGPRNMNYYGFYKQLEGAFNEYSYFLYDYDGSTYWWDIDRIHLGWSDILYHKVAPGFEHCGSASVYIENVATMSLYVYTPYQPNQAVLSGGADECSAYGNYNFFNMFSSWFGDPRLSSYEKTIEPGVYRMSLKNHSNITLATSSSGNTRLFYLSSIQNLKTEQFRFDYHQSGGYYTINVLGSFYNNQVLTLTNTDAGSQIVQDNFNDSCGQKWYIKRHNDNEYSIHSVCNINALISAHDKTQNSNIHIWGDVVSDLQRWEFNSVDIASGNYYLYNSNKTATLTAEGENVVVDAAGDVFNQRIRLDNNGGIFTFNPIAHINQSKVLTSNGVGLASEIFEATFNDSCNQKWYIENRSIIRSSCDFNKAISAQSDSIDRIKIHLWDYFGSPLQQWAIEEESHIPSGVYSIVSSINGAVVTSDNNFLSLQNFNSTDSQLYRFDYHSEGDYYTINLLNNGNGGRVLAGYGLSNGNFIAPETFNDLCNQRWKIKTNDNGGHYTIQSACDNHAVFSTRGNSQVGDLIHVWQLADYDLQTWQIKAQNY